jgi:hypothetical protein
MPWMATAAIVGSNLVGSALAGRSAERAADTSAQAQLESARIAAEAQRFRPVGITSRFGTSQFGFDDKGYLTSAGYTVDPEIQRLQNQLIGLAGYSLSPETIGRVAAESELIGGAGTRLFGTAGDITRLGQQYLATSPEAARQQFMQEQTALLDPVRRREEEALARSVFGRGRAGLTVGAQGQPELATLAAARRTQDLQLAAQAEQAAQQRAQFGTGLVGTGASLFGTAGGMLGSRYQYQTQALAPFLQQIGAAQTLEQMAQQPLDIGAQLGGRAATAGANVGQSLLAGGTAAAQTRLQGSLVGPSLMAQNLSGFGQQYLQNQQQQNMFNQLMGMRNARGFGYPAGTSQMSAQDAASWFGGFGE